MASGDSLAIFVALHNEPPSANASIIDLRNQHPIMDYDAATDEEGVVSGVLPRNYGGGGITARVGWMASTATTGTCRLQGAFERHEEDVTDLDADSFASFQSAGEAPASASGEMQYTDIVFTDGGQIDSLAVGESYRFKYRRDADGTSGTDDMAGDQEVKTIELRET